MLDTVTAASAPVHARARLLVDRDEYGPLLCRSPCPWSLMKVREGCSTARDSLARAACRSDPRPACWSAPAAR